MLWFPWGHFCDLDIEMNELMEMWVSLNISFKGHSCSLSMQQFCDPQMHLVWCVMVFIKPYKWCTHPWWTAWPAVDMQYNNVLMKSADRGVIEARPLKICIIYARCVYVWNTSECNVCVCEQLSGDWSEVHIVGSFMGKTMELIWN